MSEEKKDQQAGVQPTSLGKDADSPQDPKQIKPKYQFQDDKSFEDAALKYYNTKFGAPSTGAEDQGINSLKEDLLRVKKMLSLNNNPDILDQDLVTDLLIKGWTLEQLRSQKPFLFKKE